MSDITRIITGRDDEDAKILDNLAAAIERAMRERTGLQTLMKYRVAKRDKRDTSRFEKFSEYRGPDLETMAMLTQFHDQWLSDPGTCWHWKVEGVGDPQAYVIDTFMRDVVELRKYLPSNISARDTARALCSHNLFPKSTPEKIEGVIIDMVNRGHRYLNLEKTLGKGICLVMGTQLSETLWYKILPKSGPKFDAAMKCVRNTDAVKMQQCFVDLREVIIQSKLQELRAIPMITAWASSW